MQIITVFEHQIIEQDGFIVSDYQWLIQQIETQKLACLELQIKSNHVVIVARHYLAAIRLPSGVLLEILPKIASPTASLNNIQVSQKDISQTRQWVAKMLTDIVFTQTNTSQQISQSSELLKISTEKTWVQSLVQCWFVLLQQYANQLPKNYQQQDDNHPKAQGKLLIKKQIKHNSFRPHYRYTEKQLFQQNSLWHQFFYTVFNKIRQFEASIPRDDFRTMQSLSRSYQQNNDSMTIKILPIRQWQTSYDTLQNLLHNSQQVATNIKQSMSLLLQISWLILSNYQPLGATVGKQPSATVMINMQYAFEQWVSHVMRQTFSDQTVVTQKQTAWLQTEIKSEGDLNVLITSKETRKEITGHTRYLKPDVLVYQHAVNQQTEDSTVTKYSSMATQKTETKRVAVVADVKYKYIVSDTQITMSDIYQIFAYQQGFNAAQAWLIYPMSEGFNQAVNLKSLLNLTNDTSIQLIPFDVHTAKIVF